MRSAVPPTKIRQTARQVDSDGYKGDDEDDDDGVSVESDAAAGSGQTTGATSSADADIEAYAAAYMCEEDLVFIKTLSKGMRTKRPINKTKTASRGCTGISVTVAACESTLTTPASVSDVLNTRGIRHPSDTLLPNTISPRNARDPSPTYNQNTQNSQNRNPMYSPKAQKQQLDSHPEPTLDSDNPCIQPEAASFQEDDQTTSGPAVGDDDPFPQPYAVRYKEEDEGVGITPYAVAYMCQDDTDSTDQTYGQTSPDSSSNNNADVSAFDGTLRDSQQTDVQNTSNPNPMYAQNALNPNPMYGQNALNPNPVPNVVQEARCVSKSTPIVFGEEGTLPGQIDKPYGVAVSADNEIFVADMNNKRVQVFSMNGTFLRLFPPEVPGGNDQAMYPTDVDIDEQGRVWVVGKDRVNSFAVRVVQYGTDGLLVTTFVVKRFDWYPKIAVNSRYNRIIVLACNELFKFKPDGSFDGSFGKKEGPKLQYVTCTSDRDGNILVTDTSLPGVKVYDHTGQRLFSFRTVSVGKGKPRGICMDPQGHIMVADSGNGRVDMFTSRGKFVRTVVNVTNPWDIALGPGGQLVVTDVSNYIVTIFPRWMVFPDE
ncbi:PREDICTED: E3 ubiquitin-protein ligase TRIM71-like [Branchiostoma belcheri]|uniref:E3 ubiquitin-protein ligase TRIM71-like n=1 Tax=Branchiostoma belcheri TaxID=7741 RepID=A0A6P4Z636_BRABE|nr:PREDICTED: E3 ubiquitin-protein ligase TRIM71-like [Branchiostoma belcheri]